MSLKSLLIPGTFWNLGCPKGTGLWWILSLCGLAQSCYLCTSQVFRVAFGSLEPCLSFYSQTMCHLLFCFQLNIHSLVWRHSSHQMPKQPGSTWFVCAFLIGRLINKQAHVCLPTCTIQASRTVIVQSRSCGGCYLYSFNARH